MTPLISTTYRLFLAPAPAKRISSLGLWQRGLRHSLILKETRPASLLLMAVIPTLHLDGINQAEIFQLGIMLLLIFMERLSW